MGNRNTSLGNPLASFSEMQLDASELLRVVTHAKALFRDRAPLRFGSLSDLLDEVLPAESNIQARVARALEFDPVVLARLRNRTVDPLRVPQIPLANLAQSLGIDRGEFWYLVTADHAQFGNAASARGSSGDEDPERIFRDAWGRAQQDDPNCFSAWEE